MLIEENFKINDSMHNMNGSGNQARPQPLKTDKLLQITRFTIKKFITFYCKWNNAKCYVDSVKHENGRGILKSLRIK